jgi:hypothetical protein
MVKHLLSHCGRCIRDSREGCRKLAEFGDAMTESSSIDYGAYYRQGYDMAANPKPGEPVTTPAKAVERYNLDTIERMAFINGYKEGMRRRQTDKEGKVVA